MAPKALVTGATGFTGSRLVRRLVEAGYEVAAIARASSDLSGLRDLPIEWHPGDVFDPAVVGEAARGAEAIFHLAACYREPGVGDDVYARVHVKSTQLLAEAALAGGVLKRFVHTSTMGVHGHIETPPANEESPYVPGDVYQTTKLEAELWLREYAQKTGLPICVVRPTAIFGPGDRRLLKLFQFAKRGWFPLLDGHDTLYHLIHVDDLVEFYLLVATHDAALGEAFVCGNETWTSVKEIMGWLSQFYGTRVRFPRIPGAPLFFAADLCEAVCKPLGIDPPLYRRRVAFFTKDRAFDTRKSRDLLGFSTRYDNESGLIATARWYQEAGWT